MEQYDQPDVSQRFKANPPFRSLALSRFLHGRWFNLWLVGSPAYRLGRSFQPFTSFTSYHTFSQLMLRWTYLTPPVRECMRNPYFPSRRSPFLCDNTPLFYLFLRLLRFTSACLPPFTSLRGRLGGKSAWWFLFFPFSRMIHS